MDSQMDSSSPLAATSPEDLKDQGNAAFRKSQILRRTTAGKQYLNDAKAFYAQALQQLSEEPATPENLSLACTLHANLAAVFLQEAPPKWPEAKAAAELALAVNPRHVKALFRRAQAFLEDNREGLPQSALQAALADLQAAHQEEANNKQLAAEVERIARRIAALEQARRIPEPAEIVSKISPGLLQRGADLLTNRGYVWGQTESTVHVFVPLRERIKSDMVTFEVRLQGLNLAISQQHTLKGELHKQVLPDECNWQLEEGGLLLHVELLKKDSSSEGEHWLSVWASHEQTRAASAQESKELLSMAEAACRAEPQAPPNAKAAEMLERFRALCPGVNVEWGDTSLSGFREA